MHTDLHRQGHGCACETATVDAVPCHVTRWNTLIVWKLDRLGRARRDLLTLLDELKARDVAFRSLTEAIDPPSSGRALWQTVGIMAELERSLIQEPTRADRVAAQAGGVQRGRKP